MNTNKIDLIKDWISKEQEGLMDAQGNFEYPEHQGAYDVLCNLDAYIDSLQEEPVSKDFEMALAEMVAKAQKCVVEPWVVAAQWKDELIKLAKSEEPVSEELELTWEDMRELYIIFAEVDTEIELCKAGDIKAETIGYYQEVLKRFNKERKEK